MEEKTWGKKDQEDRIEGIVTMRDRISTTLLLLLIQNLFYHTTFFQADM